MNAVEVRELTKRFGSAAAVDRIALTVRTGEIMGFLGPNGSGKTTTIRMICGLLTADSGEGTVLGFDLIREQKKIKSQVGYMTQRFCFYEDLTVEENLAFVARAHRLGNIRQNVQQTLETLHLADRRKQIAATLSGGWKQRLALAACTMHQPRLLLLDEPTAGVDPQARREFWDEIHRLAARGLTVLVSTHYMDEAERCHRISLISGGRMIASGTAEEVAQESGLTTYVVRGPGLIELQQRLRQAEGVEQVTPFGSTLHVVGHDRGRLQAALEPLASAGSHTFELGATSIEDVFIRYVGTAGRS